MSGTREGRRQEQWPDARRASGHCSCRLLSIESLRPGEGAARYVVIPLFLDIVGMTVPAYVAALAVQRAEYPGAFIAVFIAGPVIPGRSLRVGGRLVLLVRSDVDGAIGVYISIGTVSYTARRQVSTRVGHGGIEGVAEIGVIGAEVGETTHTRYADVLVFSGKNEEDVVEARLPAFDLLRVRYLALNVGVLQGSRWIRGCIYPGACKYGIAGKAPAALRVLCIDVIQW